VLGVLTHRDRLGRRQSRTGPGSPEGGTLRDSRVVAGPDNDHFPFRSNGPTDVFETTFVNRSDDVARDDYHGAAVQLYTYTYSLLSALGTPRFGLTPSLLHPSPNSVVSHPWLDLLLLDSE
jgi:hypothetical protein